MKVLTRLPVLDEYADADRCAVMLGNDVLVLSEIPTALLRALTDGPLSLADVESRLAADFGPAPKGALAGVVEQLVAAGAALGLRNRSHQALTLAEADAGVGRSEPVVAVDVVAELAPLGDLPACGLAGGDRRTPLFPWLHRPRPGGLRALVGPAGQL